jgi:hypothetical protein
MSYNKSKKRQNKNKSQKRKTQKRKTMKGGGDFFISKPEQPSFSDVPLKSFYTMNRLNEGSDVQHMQQSSRLMGGRRKQSNTQKRKQKKHRKNQRGGGILDTVSRLITPSNPNVIADSGNANGLPSQANILTGKGLVSNGPFPIKMDSKPYLV